jgi:hypothetical protein
MTEARPERRADGMSWSGRSRPVHKLLDAFTVKASRKCLSSCIRREVYRKDDQLFILVAIKPCRLISIAIEPRAHRDHLTSKIPSQYSNGRTTHASSPNVLALLRVFEYGSDVK